MQIFNNTAFVAPSTPSIVPFVDTYKHQGCFREGSDGRALRNDSFADDGLLVNVCTKYCLGKGFQYAGVEYG